MKSEIKAGSTLSYLIIILNIVSNILITPLIIRSLGVAEYGLYQLIGVLVGYIALLDFGLGNTIIKYIAKYRSLNDSKAQENFLALVMIIYIFLTIIVLILGYFLYSYINVFFESTLTESELNKAKTMFLILVINLSLSLLFNAFPSIMGGCEKFIAQKSIVVLRIIFRSIILTILLLSGGDAISIVILDTVLNLLFAVIAMIYVFKILKVKIKLWGVDKRLLSEILTYSFYIFLGFVVDQIFWKTGQLVVGITKGANEVGIFAIGMTFPSYYILFSNAIAVVFLPKFTRLSLQEGSEKETNDLFIKIGRMQFIILGIIIVGFISIGKQFIVLWVGPEFLDAYYIALLIMIPYTIPLIQNAGIVILQARNLHKFRSISGLIIAVINTFVSFYLSKNYGLIGVALGTGVSLVVGNVILLNFYYRYKVGLDIIRFVKEVSKGILPAIILTYLLSLSFHLLPSSSWVFFIIYVFILCVIYSLAIWFIGVNTREKDMVRKLINKSKMIIQLR